MSPRARLWGLGRSLLPLGAFFVLLDQGACSSPLSPAGSAGESSDDSDSGGAKTGGAPSGGSASGGQRAGSGGRRSSGGAAGAEGEVEEGSGGKKASGGAEGSGGESSGGADPGPDLIDECAEGTHNCDENASCLDTESSFKCTCNDGYTGSGKVGQCEDIDECKIGMHDCSPHATCLNETGSYRCACNVPYFGDGVSCTCRKPSKANLVAQGGLDTAKSVGEHTAENQGAVWSSGDGVSWVSNDDSESCPDSGALQIVNTRNQTYATSTICVPVKGNQGYYLGLKYKRTRGGKFACQPIYYAKPGCENPIGYGGPTISIARATSDDGTWRMVTSGVDLSASNAQSAMIYCRSELASNDEMSATWVWIDQVFFNSENGEF
jgi:hypothetical protein